MRNKKWKKRKKTEVRGCNWSRYFKYEDHFLK